MRRSDAIRKGNNNNKDETPKIANCGFFCVRAAQHLFVKRCGDETRISTRENTRIISSEALKDRQLNARISIKSEEERERNNHDQIVIVDIILARI
jgi:hypothetical protein